MYMDIYASPQALSQGSTAMESLLHVPSMVLATSLLLGALDIRTWARHCVESARGWSLWNCTIRCHPVFSDLSYRYIYIYIYGGVYLFTCCFYPEG